MPFASGWGRTPRRSVEFACARSGLSTVVAGCVHLVEGGDADPGLVMTLGGPAAERVLSGRSRTDDRYWLRVWGMRGLLWAWDDSTAAGKATRTALTDDAWRVREMAAKVAAKRSLGDALPALVLLRADPVPRVRASADRAVRILTRAGA